LIPGFISLSVFSKGSSINKGQSSFMIVLLSVSNQSKVLEKLLVGDLAARGISFHGGHLLLNLIVEFGNGQALPGKEGHGEQEQGIGQGVAALGGRQGGGVWFGYRGTGLGHSS
jgi:hypothetical protein